LLKRATSFTSYNRASNIHNTALHCPRPVATEWSSTPSPVNYKDWDVMQEHVCCTRVSDGYTRVHVPSTNCRPILDVADLKQCLIVASTRQSISGVDGCTRDGTPTHIHIHFIFLASRIIGLHFATNDIGLSSLKFLWWAP